MSPGNIKGSLVPGKPAVGPWKSLKVSGFGKLCCRYVKMPHGKGRSVFTLCSRSDVRTRGAAAVNLSTSQQFKPELPGLTQVASPAKGLDLPGVG